VIGSSLAIPPSVIDEVDGDDEIDADGVDDDEVDEDGVDDDEVDEDGPTGRARMCCRLKPAGEQ
jgi:hypothetical protein